MSTAKVLCGACGHVLGRVTETLEGRAYSITAGHGGVTNSAAGLWCAEHGWPDLDDPKLAAKLASTHGRVVTHRARMLPRPPIAR